VRPLLNADCSIHLTPFDITWRRDDSYYLTEMNCPCVSVCVVGQSAIYVEVTANIVALAIPPLLISTSWMLYRSKQDHAPDVTQREVDRSTDEPINCDSLTIESSGLICQRRYFFLERFDRIDPIDAP